MPRFLIIFIVSLVASNAACGQNGTTQRIMGWRDLLAREKPRPDATIRYGDHPLQCIDIWKPEGRSGVPAVLMLHGGCWQTRIAERDLMNWIADDLRKHGVGVWNIEYRGVDREGGYPGTYSDVATAADLFMEEGDQHGFSRDKIIAIGHSAGGHLALWLGNRPALPKNDPFRGRNPVAIDLAISQGGLPDLEAGAKRNGHACGTAAPRKMLGPQPRRTSPPEMLPGKARQVLFHNTRDGIAPPQFARRYVARMVEKKVDVTLIETPAEGHVELIAPDTTSWSRQRDLILREFGLR